MRRAELKLRSFIWYNEIIKLLEPFDPEVINIKINYNYRTCEVRIKINIEPSNIEKLRKLSLPKYEDYRIKDIMNSNFESIINLFSLEGNVYKCTEVEISDNQPILMIFEGKVNPILINNLVRVQPAMNRDQTDEVDRYWLDAVIKDIKMWNEIWNPLEIEDVDVYVDVSLDRCFSVIMPTDIKKRIDAVQKFLQAGKQKNQEAMNKAWWGYRTAIREEPITVEKVLQIGRKLLEPDTFNEYIEVDKPYRIGSVERASVKRTLPDDITVIARTDLNSENPIAKGYLSFQKQIFIEILRKELELL